MGDAYLHAAEDGGYREAGVDGQAVLYNQSGEMVGDAACAGRAA